MVVCLIPAALRESVLYIGTLEPPLTLAQKPGFVPAALPGYACFMHTAMYHRS